MQQKIQIFQIFLFWPGSDRGQPNGGRRPEPASYLRKNRKQGNATGHYDFLIFGFSLFGQALIVGSQREADDRSLHQKQGFKNNLTEVEIHRGRSQGSPGGSPGLSKAPGKPLGEP